MSKFVSIGLAFVMVLGLAGTVLAQRDAGAKARGDFGNGFWNSRRVNQGVYYRPVQPTQSYQAYSYEPLGVNRGDAVIVTDEATRLMRGRNVVAKVEKGQEFEVTRIINGWLGAVLKQDGKTVKGWIWHKNVKLAENSPPASAPENR